ASPSGTGVVRHRIECAAHAAARNPNIAPVRLRARQKTLRLEHAAHNLNNSRSQEASHSISGPTTRNSGPGFRSFRIWTLLPARPTGGGKDDDSDNSPDLVPVLVPPDS